MNQSELNEHKTAGAERSVRAFGLSIDKLLIFVPVAVFLEHVRPDAHTLIFFAAGVGIIPLAAWLGRAVGAARSHDFLVHLIQES